MDLSDLFSQVRTNGAGANHAISLGGAWYELWQQMLDKCGLSDDHCYVMSFTYCLCPADSRRLIMTYDQSNRVLYPMWWDENHQVNPAGDRPAVFAPEHVDHSGCLHSPDHFSAWA